MEDVFRWSLLVLGGCTIVGVAVHGIWVSRKNSDDHSSNQNKEQLIEPDYYNKENHDGSPVVEQDTEIEPLFTEELGADHNFDELGLGAVRVVSGDLAAAEQPQSQDSGASSASQGANTTHSDGIDVDLPLNAEGPDKVEFQQPISALDETPKAKPAGKVYASVVTQPKPEFTQSQSSKAAPSQHTENTARAKVKVKQQAEQSIVTGVDRDTAGLSSTLPEHQKDGYDAPEPPPFLLKKDNAQEPSFGLDTPIDEVQNVPKADVKKTSLAQQAKQLVKGKRSSGQSGRKEPKLSDDQMRIDFEEEPKTKPAAPQQQEVLVLNVKSADAEPISGAALLPMLLTLGFKFGDQDIFHRHVNASGKGPVLFSLANMFKPGIFDIDNLENFTTQGVSLFMILPIDGDPHQVFNMMHNAARKIADEFDAQIYDAKRVLLTKQSLQQYVEKIREFEKHRATAG